MARLYQSGAEIDAGLNFIAVSGLLADGSSAVVTGGVVTRDTSVFRSGAASFKYNSGASSGNAYTSTNPTYVDGRSYFLRAYVFLAAAPTTAAGILSLGQVTGGSLCVRLRTDGTLELILGSTVQGSPSVSVTDSSWHRVELKGTATATTTWTAAELQVDGVSVATWSGSVARTDSFSVWGWTTAPVTASPGASKILNVDDVALNDSTGAANNSWPGDGKIVLLKPTADSAKGTGWTNDAAGTTNFYQAEDNTPPDGIADTTGSTGLHQIRNATSNANSNYDATMTTYTTAGVGGSDTINAVQAWVATGAPVTTSSKQGTVGVVSNPTIANVALAALGTAGAFWGGSAAGTWLSVGGWKWSAVAADAPSVTLGTAPVMRITQVTASTRIAMVCSMGIYVDYTPAAAAAAAIPDVNMALAVT